VSAKIPDEAFDFYLGLGPSRSYQAVADRYGVTKRAVVKHAMRDKWAERLREIQERARAQSDKALADDLVEMRDRHRKMLRAMAVRALAGLKELPLKNGMEAVRAAELVIRMERIVFGEPDPSGSDSIEEVTRREIQSLLVMEEDDEPEVVESREEAPQESPAPPPPLPGNPKMEDEDDSWFICELDDQAQ